MPYTAVLIDEGIENELSLPIPEEVLEQAGIGEGDVVEVETNKPGEIRLVLVTTRQERLRNIEVS